VNFQYRNIKIGADPELFLKNKATGEYVPACDLIGGSKEKPKKIDKKGHAVQEDNVMAEYNIRPASSAAQFVESHNFVLGYLREALPEFDLGIVASVEFKKEQLAHPKASVFGCDPDYNAWTMTINPPPGQNSNLRTAGGHIHIGYDGAHISNQIPLVKAMDLFVGVPSILLDPDNRRRERYGKAGAFRPKEYGVEHRTPSNFWIGSDKLMAWAFNNSHKAAAFAEANVKVLEKRGQEIQNTINKSDRANAERLCREYELLQGV
jgi:hypothetical protein